MNITRVKVFPVYEDKLKAFVSVVFDNCFMVNDIKVIQGKDGLFLSMPSRRKKSGEFKDVAHPLNNGTRRMLEERVLSEYRTVVHDPTPRRPDRPQEEAPVPALGVVPPSVPAANGTNTEAHRAAPENHTEAPESVPTSSDKTLEEVQEHHLSDSFWSVS